MTAEIIQFVPGLKRKPMYPNGCGSFSAAECQALEASALAEWTKRAVDTSPSEYSAPDGDCA